MDQLLTVWSGLDVRRKIVVVGATLAMFAAIFGISRMASQPSMELLYSGLEPAPAGEVVAALDQRGVAYEVRSGAIFVDAAQRDALRMSLATEGLPATSGQGYELLDNLSGFGTTSQMFDAAYWRAKEGELARTITSSPQVQAARVHISNQTSNPFQRNIRPTASVTVSAASGTIAPGQANAFRYLVSSAVAGLSPEDVAVIDARTGNIIASEDNSLASSTNDRAEALKQNIQRILEARVGFGNAVVEVSLETETERESIFERRFDPDGRVAVSSDTEERTTSSSGTQEGGVTVASNLPDGDAAGNANSSQSEDSEVRERINYEVSETTREVLRSPGSIRKLSVAVLVDGIRTPDPTTGELVWEPRSEDELASLQELVESAVGFDEARGDTITLKTMEFDKSEIELPDASPSLMESLNIDTMSLIQLAVLAFVALTLGLFVVRPILASSRPNDAPALPAPEDQDDTFGNEMSFNTAFDPADLGPLPGQGALNGEIDDGSAPLPGFADLGMLGGDGSTDDPVDKLRQLIDERKEETVEVLRNWMETDQERAS